MNLLQYPWIKAIRDGTCATLSVAEISDPAVTELDFTRIDFNGGVFQMLIGLLQSAMPPQSADDWACLYYEPPSAEDLNRAFVPFLAAFELQRENGPAFMQDLELAGVELNSVASLLIDSPGGKTIKDNTDHFIKRGGADKLCPSCTAAALYSMQSMSPSGGVGYRTSIRGGGGGLATLVLPQNPQATLWQKLWLNVVCQDHPVLETTHHDLADIFPWLKATPTSEKKGTEVLPTAVNPLQMFWGMPRRLRLDNANTCEGHCDLCGDGSELNYTAVQAKNYGINYGDGWLHLLTQYRFDPKKAKPPLSVKGKQGGLSYRDWLGVAIGDKDGSEQPAAVVSDFLSQKLTTLDNEDKDYRLWCFGYDMDNAKVRCWYEHSMPLVALADEDRLLFVQRMGEYIDFAKEAASVLKQAVKQAWFTRPKDAKGDMSKVDNGFWHNSDKAFFQLVQKVRNTQSDRNRWVECDIFWRDTLTTQINRQFEHWALDKFTGDRDLPRVIKARQSLHKLFYSLKAYKDIKKRVDAIKKETA